MRTVPLRGKKAAGRVALVDDEDYGLVMQYRWHLWEYLEPGRRPDGPYAVTSFREGGRSRSLRMHTLISGAVQTDHANHDGLDNQRHNLRPATATENGRNQRKKLSGTSSQYKGLCWRPQKRKWLVSLAMNGQTRRIGEFVSELEAAYAYDQAARDLFGSFACTNFEDGPTQAVRGQWQAERDARAELIAERRRAHGARVSGRWKDRQPEAHTCAVCGVEYQTKALNSLYCSAICRRRKGYQQERERQLEGRLF